MPPRMSCALTTDAVRDRTKRVTRRAATTWAKLKPGDRLTLIEKGMGLPKGARQVVLAEVEVTDVRVELLTAIADEPDGTALEGLGHLDAAAFIDFWLLSHGHHRGATPAVRRIEWRYLDAEEV